MSLQQNKAYSKGYPNTTKKTSKRENIRKNEDKIESNSSEEYAKKDISEIKENKKRKAQNKFHEIESTKLESEKMEDDRRENRFLRRRTLSKIDSEEDDSEGYTTKTREKNNTQKITFVNTDRSDSEFEGGKDRLLRKKTLRNKDSEKEDDSDSEIYSTKTRKKNNRQTITLVDLDISDSESNDESIIETQEKMNEEKKKRTIFVKIFKQRLHESDLFQIFNKYGPVSKVELKTQYSGLIEFFDKSTVDRIMSNKKKIFFKGKNLVIQNARKIILEKRYQMNNKKLNEEKIDKSSKTLEFKNIEDKKEKFIDMKINQPKLENEDGHTSLKDTVNDIIKNMEDYKTELNKQGKELGECKKVITEQGEIIAKQGKELEKCQWVIAQQGETIDKQAEIITQNQKEISNLKISLNIMAEINEQKDIYYKSNFEYLNRNVRLLLNLYKVLYIRKFANLLLEQIYKKYSKDLGKGKVQVGKNKHTIISLLPQKKGELKDRYYRINLLVDFLRFIWDESSKEIHIDDKNFPLQKEIFSEYLKPLKNTYSGKIENKEGIKINVLTGLIFENKEKVNSKENNIILSNNNLVNAIQKMLKKLEINEKNTIDLNNDEN